jgi:hypothetical protein
MKSRNNRLCASTHDPSLASGGESKILKNWEYRGYWKIKQPPNIAQNCNYEVKNWQEFVKKNTLANVIE